MKIEIIINSHAAMQAILLINEYLHKGGTGFDDEALCSVRDALSEADRIVIMSYKDNGKDGYNEQ